MNAVKGLHLAVLCATCGMATAFYGSVSSGAGTHAYFAETYFGCIAASAVLSTIALFIRPGLWLYAVLGLRTYVLMVFGYSIDAFLSSRLVMGIGLMTETGILCGFPAGLIVGGCSLAALAAAQGIPAVFGTNGLVDRVPTPAPDQLAAYCLVLAVVVVASSFLSRASVRRQELDDILRIQQTSLDTLSELNMNLQGYARTIDEESSERERQRISREIHDISGYIFTNLIALMDAAGSMPRDDQSGLTDLLITARKTAQEGLRETRAALRRLRNEQMRESNVPRALFKIVSIFHKITGLKVTLSLGNLPNSLGHELSLALYRTVQEALTNAVRHGKASQVRVIFWVDGDRLRLSITDNGKGAFEIVKGIGLAGMEERLGALGGSVSVGPAPEGGFSLLVSVPLKTGAETSQMGGLA